MSLYNPATYDAWYETPRGHWIAEREFALMEALLRPRAGATLLDVGAGTGHFSRRFAAAGLKVTALDPDPAMLDDARRRGGDVDAFVEGAAERLPFPDGAFDYAAAVTSLCFVADPQRAVAELWRVSRRGVVLGLLNRRSLLHRQKADRGGYRGARWDSADAIRDWVRPLEGVNSLRFGSALFLPGGGPLSRAVERLLPRHLLRGGFLAATLGRR